jgi:hypothetical protein
VIREPEKNEGAIMPPPRARREGVLQRERDLLVVFVEFDVCSLLEAPAGKTLGRFPSPRIPAILDCFEPLETLGYRCLHDNCNNGLLDHLGH